MLETEVAFGEYLALRDYKLDRREELDRQIEAMALEPSYKEAVGRLCCLKGISTQAAMVLVTEIGDFRRFEHPGKLMDYLGLVPSEHSSGGTRRQGSITKAGNSRARHVLVQAAWTCRFPPRRGAVLKRRQEGQPPDAIAHSWKAQHRLNKVFKRLAFRKNNSDRSGGSGQGTGRVRVGSHAGERGRDRSRAARRLRSYRPRTIPQMLKRIGRPRHGRRTLALAMWPGPKPDSRPTRPRSSQLPTNPNSCRTGPALTGVYQEDSPSKRTSGDLSFSL